MTDENSLPTAVELIGEAARLLGLSLHPLDPEFGYLFELTDGKKRKVLVGGRSPLNDAVAARIAEDKFYTCLLLGRAGIKVPDSARCLKPDYFALEAYDDKAGLHEAKAFATRHGFPLIVKPNHLSHGRQVSCVADFAQLCASVEQVWHYDYIALVQTAHPGLDIRLDFLDGEYLIGYTRKGTPGDDSPVPILNLSQGARADLHRSISKAWSDRCTKIARTLNLRFLGIDFKAPSIDSDPAEATVIEVNSSPLLVGLYLGGQRQRAIEAEARVLQAVWNLP